MHISLSKEQYKELETAIGKIASKEFIDNINFVELSMKKDAGFLRFNTEENIKDSFLSKILAEINTKDFNIREAGFIKNMATKLLNARQLGPVFDWIVEKGKEKGYDDPKTLRPIIESLISKYSPNNSMLNFFTDFLVDNIIPEIAKAHSEFKETEQKPEKEEDIVDAEFKMKKEPEKVKKINPRKELEKLEEKEEKISEEKDPFAELNIEIDEDLKEPEGGLDTKIPEDYTPIGKAAIDKINSDSFLIRKGATSYSVIEESLIKFAKENDINDVEEIEIHINPFSSYLKFKQSDNKERIVTSDFSIGGLIANPLAQMAQNNHKTTGLLNIAASFAQSKLTGKGEVSLKDTVILPYLEGMLGGAYTAGAGRIAQQMGLGGWSYVAAIGIGFILDSVTKSTITEDAEEKKKHDADAAKMIGKMDKNFQSKLLDYANKHNVTITEAFKEMAKVTGMPTTEES